MAIFVEVRPTVKRAGPPILVPLAEVHKHTGFRTIVGYSSEVADMIREQGSTLNLKHLPVYADTMFMDFDGHDPVEFRTWLQASGLAYTEWDSGNRSFHYHIAMEPIEGTWVTAAMKAWTKQHAPTADVSFCHPAGMYRLPGTFHHKQPGRCKTLLHSQPGTCLRLERPALDLGLRFQLDEPTGTQEEFFRLLMQAKNEGHRAPHLFKLAITGAESGMSYEEVLEHMRWWNRFHASPPRDDLTIQSQCDSAFRRLARKKA